MSKQNKLALFGGEPIIPKGYNFERYNTIGLEEKEAVSRVLDSGILSDFVASWGEHFLGGREVQSFERDWEKYFGVKHAISVNSWTSGLTAMIGSIGISPGDEIIVSPWTMSATATAIVMWGGIPVFADIEDDFFCLDPYKVESLITERTKAVLTVDIFGQSSDIFMLRKICNDNNLFLLSDTAQAIGSKYDNSFSGTLCDIGGYSLNYHKHIHTGEGGVLVTNDDELALKMRLIRNHAECSVSKSGISDITNMIGGNYRMCEIEAAIGKCQLMKLASAIDSRQKVAASLYEGLNNISGIKLPMIRDKCSHVYYTFPITIDDPNLFSKRDKIVDALFAEGVDFVSKGYTNLLDLPMYQKKIALGKHGFPWSLQSESAVSYDSNNFPVVNHFQKNALINLEVCVNEFHRHDLELVIECFKKVFNLVEEL